MVCGDLNVDTFVDAEPIKYTRDKMTSVQSGLSLLTAGKYRKCESCEFFCLLTNNKGSSNNRHRCDNCRAATGLPPDQSLLFVLGDIGQSR